jgi:hypothetical protein
MHKAKIQVYLKGGTKHEYEIKADSEADLGAKAGDHSAAIMYHGFRQIRSNGEFTWWGPHWIDKIKVIGAVYTTYPTEPTGT